MRASSSRSTADEIVVTTDEGAHRPVQAHQVQALQPGHLRQPAADRPQGRAGREGRRDRRRPRHRERRGRARQERAHRLYDLGGLQLRGRRAHQRAARPRGHLHLYPYRRIRHAKSRDTKLGPEEITRDIPNVGEDVLKDLDERRRHPHRRGGPRGRHPRRQGHPEGRDRADRARSGCCAPSSAKRRARCATPRCGVPHGE